MLNAALTANSIRLSITRSDYLTLDHRWRNEDAWLNQTRIYYIESGAGYLKTESQTIPLEPGYAYVIPSQLHFGYGCSRLKKLYFHIRLSTADQHDLLSQLGGICRIPYDPEDLKIMVRCSESEECIDLIRLKSMLMQTLCKAAAENHCPPVRFNSYSEFLTQAIELIHASPSIKLTGQAIASSLFTSESRLRNAFKNEMNITFGQYVDQCVFRKSKVMLSDPTITIDQISQHLGFCDRFYFSRRFKQRYGITPIEYRKSIAVTT